MSFDIKFTGIKELNKALKKNATLADVKTIVKQDGARLTAQMKKNTHTAFVKGYSTGDTANSINMLTKDGGFTAVVGATTEYAPYVEYGTRFMQAEPFVRPAYAVISKQFEMHLRKLMR